MTMWCKTCRAFTEWTSERCCDCGRGLDLNCAQPFFASEGRTAGLIEIPRGTILGERFNVIEECGAGRSGTIFVVFDGILGHAVAAKVTAAAPEASGEAARLQREVTLYERVRDHRHVLKLYGAHMVERGGGRLLLLTMEYADGGALRSWMETHHCDVDIRRKQGMNYLGQMCVGLAELEAVGILPLDVKPENALLVNGVLKVADLEGAALCGADGGLGVCAPDVPPRVLGTLGYMSPEQRRAQTSDELGFETAVFAVAVILFELLDPQARRPTDDYGNLRSESWIAMTLDSWGLQNEKLITLIARCLSCRPGDRHPTMAGFHEALCAACGLESEYGIGRVSCSRSSSYAGDLDAVRAALADNHLEDARTECKRILTWAPDHNEALALLEDLDNRYGRAERLYAAVAKDMDAQPLEWSAALIQEAASGYPQHPDASLVRQCVLERAKTYRQQLESGWRAVKNQSWGAASVLFAQAAHTNPGDAIAAALAELLTNLNQTISEGRRRINDALGAGEQGAAIALACQLDRKIDEAERNILEMRSKAS